MVALQYLPAPSDGAEELFVEVSIFAEDVRQKLKQHIESIRQDLSKDEDDKRSLRVLYVECVASKRQKELEEARRDGCVSELFELSTRARELGWTSLLVADDLTKRQVDGDANNLRAWEKADQATVVVIHLRPGFSPLAKRLPLKAAVRVLYDGDAESAIQSSEHEEMQPYESGHVLHDPNGRLFSSSAQSSRAKLTRLEDAIAADAGLPAEISDIIKGYAHEDPAVEDMSSLPRGSKFMEIIVPILAIGPAPESIIKSVQHDVEELYARIGGREQRTWKIFPWNLGLSATRRQVYKLYEGGLMGTHKGFFERFKDEHFLWDAELWSDRQTILISPEKVGILAKIVDVEGPIRLKAMIDQGHRMSSQSPRDHEAETKNGKQQDSLRHDVHEKSFLKEILLDYDQRFFYDPPDWAPCGYESLPVIYFLTKHLSDKDIRKIKHELVFERNDADDSYSEEPKQYHFVPWTKSVDGTAEDVVRIHTLCKRYSSQWHCPGQEIFIDAQSAKDLTVIISNTWYSMNTMRYLGAQYGRLAARDAHIAWINLEIANTDIEDHVDEVDDLNKIKDPDNPESESENSESDSEDIEPGQEEEHDTDAWQ